MIHRDLSDAELVNLEVRARAHGSSPRNEPMLAVLAELRRRRAADERAFTPSTDLLMSVRAYERAVSKRDSFARAHAVVTSAADHKQVEAQISLFGILVQRTAEAVAALATRELTSLLGHLPRVETRTVANEGAPGGSSARPSPNLVATSASSASMTSRRSEPPAPPKVRALELEGLGPRAGGSMERVQPGKSGLRRDALER